MCGIFTYIWHHKQKTNLGKYTLDPRGMYRQPKWEVDVISTHSN